MNPYVIPGIKEIYRKESAPKITHERIVDAVCEHFGVTIEDLKSKSRKLWRVYPRQIAMFLILEHSTMNFRRTGEYFGGRDHTTAIHSQNRINDLMDGSEKIKKEIELIRSKILYY